MKRILAIIVCSFLLVSCGTGTYTVSSGRQDQARISFVDKSSQEITVFVDDAKFVVETVKEKAYKANRNIKQTSSNSITIPTGTREVKVFIDDECIFNAKLFVSSGEHRVIEL